MVFNKVTVCVFVLGLIAVSAFPTEKKDEKSEVEVQTTLRTLSDDVQDDVVTTQASDIQSDDVVVTTSLPPSVRSEENPQAVKVVPETPEVETKVVAVETIVVPEEKTGPVVVAEVVGEKVVPIVEVVEVVPVPAQTAPAADVKTKSMRSALHHWLNLFHRRGHPKGQRRRGPVPVNRIGSGEASFYGNRQVYGQSAENRFGYTSYGAYDGHVGYED